MPVVTQQKGQGADRLPQPGWTFTLEGQAARILEDSRDVQDRAIDSHIKNLRRKLEELEPDRGLSVTIYGVGYRIDSLP